MLTDCSIENAYRGLNICCAQSIECGMIMLLGIKVLFLVGYHVKMSRKTPPIWDEFRQQLRGE